jgi:hypothetical protein
MKPILYLVTLLLTVSTLNAQKVDDDVNKGVFLFPKFEQSDVYLKGGKLAQAELNYNTNTHKFIFIYEHQYQELIDLQNIDSVLIGTNKYIVIDGNFYQCTRHPNLYILYNYDLNHKEVTTTKSGTYVEDKSKVSNTVTNVYALKNYKNFDNYENVAQYWFYSNGQLCRVIDTKKLAQRLNVNKTQILDYINAHNLDLNQEPDVLKLLNWFQNKTK